MTDDQLKAMFDALRHQGADPRFSHAELDRRVRALEESHRTVTETLADVQARLERLESSTH